VFGGRAAVSVLGTAFGGEGTLSVAAIAVAACSRSWNVAAAADKVGVGVDIWIPPWFGLLVIVVVVVVVDLC